MIPGLEDGPAFARHSHHYNMISGPTGAWAFRIVPGGQAAKVTVLCIIYLSCEEVIKSDPPQARSSLDHWYRMGLPDGYDKSPLRMEVVLLESQDQCASWNVISRWPAMAIADKAEYGTQPCSRGMADHRR